ncbi:MAG: cell division protein FtsQ/DivIB [Candidatus Omnitrophica bacterium]|nr:cell division protein FtsQ/DivIB [Candidatus Omnitrophota bacterium]MDD5026897.1 cell division protein FtsQ/DivIB [Candidatus Omnitrophota bacterium]MDD5662171.1 cell division protein FtsQ/DivIB [Candidatus Omnitrophota bacterium]
MKKRKINFPARLLVFSLIILLALLFILGYIWRVLSAADYFLVRDVIANQACDIDLSYLKGKNIFSLSLSRESENIARFCPDCSRVRLARIIPDRIFVEFVKRQPVAFIKFYRYFAVDAEGVIFSSSLQPQDSGLPIILGLETKIFGPKTGKKYNNKELSVALLILKEAGKNRLFREYKIRKINVTGEDNITIQIPILKGQDTYANWKAPEKNGILEIKIGQGNIRDKVAIVAGLINQEKHNLDNIKYIDLRFKEPVIKFKDVK